MASTDWDPAVPANTDQLSSGDDTIRDFKDQHALRQDKEHVAMGSSSAGGEHSEGSAKIYYEDSAPTNRPDGSTALNSADAGRIWQDSDDDTIDIYSGSTWVSIPYLTITGGTLTGNLSFSGSETIAGITNTNLLDKSATETVSGAYTFSNTTTFSGNIAFSGSETIGGITNTNLVDKSAVEAITGLWTFSDTLTVTNATADNGLVITNSSSGDALVITVGTNASATGIGITSGGAGDCLSLSATSGTHINMNAVVNGSISTGDFWGVTNGLKFSPISGGGSRHIPMANGAGGASSAGAGNQYIGIEIDGTIYKVLHDGTV